MDLILTPKQTEALQVVADREIHREEMITAISPSKMRARSAANHPKVIKRRQAYKELLEACGALWKNLESDVRCWEEGIDKATGQSRGVTSGEREKATRKLRARVTEVEDHMRCARGAMKREFPQPDYVISGTRFSGLDGIISKSDAKETTLGRLQKIRELLKIPIE